MYTLILITLDHIERGNRVFVDPNEIYKRINNYLETKNIYIKYIVISKEKHEEEGNHYHVVLKNTGFTDSKTKIIKEFRNIFPEFDGYSFDLAMERGENGLLEYITKEDKEPKCFHITLEEVFEKVNNRQRKMRQGLSNEEVHKLLLTFDTWENVIKDKQLGPVLVRSYNSIKKLFFDLKNSENKAILTTKSNEIILAETNKIKKINKKEMYDLDDFTEEQKYIMYWIYVNVRLETRKFRKEQLLIVGESSSGKSLFIRNLLESLKINYFEIFSNDMTGYNDEYELLLLDEFQYKNFDRSFLLRLLEGSPLQITGKYQEMTMKKKNLPIILILNPSELPEYNKKTEAFYNRVTFVNFQAKFIRDFDEKSVNLIKLKNSFLQFNKFEKKNQFLKEINKYSDKSYVKNYINTYDIKNTQINIFTNKYYNVKK